MDTAAIKSPDHDNVSPTIQLKNPLLGPICVVITFWVQTSVTELVPPDVVVMLPDPERIVELLLDTWVGVGDDGNQFRPQKELRVSAWLATVDPLNTQRVLPPPASVTLNIKLAVAAPPDKASPTKAKNKNILFMTSPLSLY